eukprot:COSAG04_NODE_6565_length_1303_cov_37.258203_3_plen_83_part_01
MQQTGHEEEQEGHVPSLIHPEALVEEELDEEEELEEEEDPNGDGEELAAAEAADAVAQREEGAISTAGETGEYREDQEEGEDE